MKPIIVLVGRPNVGKSTLVNRMLGRREAVVAEQPGVTRDRKSFQVEWTGRHFEVVDTGGWEAGPKDSLAESVCKQAEMAIEVADLVVFVVDAEVGITEEDTQVAKLLRRAGGSKVLVAANKVDSKAREPAAAEAYSLGLGEVFPVSALHGRSSGELLDAIVGRLGLEAERPPPEGPEPAIAIVGRPNAGKSTIFNRLVGEERSIVNEIPGTTRDTVDLLVEIEGGKRYRFVDTAGLRRRSRIDDKVEYYGAVRTFEAIDRSDLVLLVVDSEAGITQQDQRLAERAVEGGCAVVVVLNKWDLLGDEAKAEIEADFKEKLRFVAFAPMVRTSAVTGRGLFRILPELDKALAAYEGRIPTHRLNEALAAAFAHHPPRAGRRGDRPRLLYATQAATRPPTFVLFTTRRLDSQYLNYLDRWIRENAGVGPTPMRIRVRPRAIRGGKGKSGRGQKGAARR